MKINFPLFVCMYIYNLIKNFIQDGNGYIDRQELAIMLRFMGENISEAEIRDIIEEADVDKDGLIDYSGRVFSMNLTGSNDSKPKYRTVYETSQKKDSECC